MKLLVNRWLHFFLLMALLASAIHFSNSDFRWRKELQNLAFDQLNREHPRHPSDDVIIVDIDDDSLQRIGQWPWPRTIMAEIISRLTAMGAKVVVFDGVMAEPDRSSPDLLAENLPEETEFESLRLRLQTLETHDQILAKAIEDSDIFVSAFTFGNYSQKTRDPELKKQVLAKKEEKNLFLNQVRKFSSTVTSLPEIEKAAAGNGSFMVTADEDGVLRRTSLLFSNGKDIYPSLTLEALRIGSDLEKYNYKIGRTPQSNLGWIDTSYRLLLGDYTIPITNDGTIHVYYRPFDENGEDYLSAYKILDPAFEEIVNPLINGSYVLMGTSAEGLKDLRSTSIEKLQPGVEIHANVIEQILQGRFLIRPDAAILAEMCFIAAIGLSMILLAPFVHVLFLGLVCVASIALAFWGSTQAYLALGILLDPFYPSICVFALFVLSVLLTFLRVESEKAQVRDAFGLYISRDFMRELTKNPDKLKLGGEIRDLSVMFTDIRSFTSISEGLEPEELIQLMNDFLTPMSDLVMQNRGTIDKYMGDAMMAFWNAPLDDEDHERHACLAALGMQKALAPINDELAKKAEEKGTKAILLQAGIGINTGPCAVGNMGSRQRFAYSTLGDAVNLASRLEGQTKNYGVDILIGETTQRAVPELATLEVDLITVKGKTEPVHVFALIGDEEVSQSEEFKKWQKLHNAMLEKYRDQDFTGAQKLADTTLEITEPKWQTLYDLYKSRCEEFLKALPPKDWDGVFIATSK